MHPHELHFDWNSPYLTVTPAVTFDLPITGFLPSFSDTPTLPRED